MMEPTFTAIGASVLGAQHVRNGLPNQDAFRWDHGRDGALVCAVADGHGGERYVRSDIGSRLAVQAVVEVSVAMTLDPDASATDAETYMARIMAATVERWRAEVTSHFSGHPATPEEIRRAGGPIDDDPHIAYGCTLIVAVLGDRHAVFGQIGDGDVTVVTVERGVSQPIPDDARNIGNATVSMCMPGAAETSRCAVVPASDVDLVILSSDGYGNSFSDDAWYRTAGADLADKLTELGPGPVNANLPDWLAASAEASGDDTTAVLAYRRPGAAPVPPIRPARRGLVVSVIAALLVGALLGAGLMWLLDDDTTATTEAGATTTIPVDDGGTDTTPDAESDVDAASAPPVVEASVHDPNSGWVIGFRNEPGNESPRVYAFTYEPDTPPADDDFFRIAQRGDGTEFVRRSNSETIPLGFDDPVNFTRLGGENGTFVYYVLSLDARYLQSVTVSASGDIIGPVTDTARVTNDYRPQTGATPIDPVSDDQQISQQ